MKTTTDYKYDLPTRRWKMISKYAVKALTGECKGVCQILRDLQTQLQSTN